MNSELYGLLFYRQNHFMYPAGLLAALLLSACMPPQKQNYETTLFDTGRVHTVEVSIAPEDWQDLLAHPEKKTKYEADLIIDGEEISQVSFSTKGEFQSGVCGKQPLQLQDQFRQVCKRPAEPISRIRPTG